MDNQEHKELFTDHPSGVFVALPYEFHELEGAAWMNLGRNEAGIWIEMTPSGKVVIKVYRAQDENGTYEPETKHLIHEVQFEVKVGGKIAVTK